MTTNDLGDGPDWMDPKAFSALNDEIIRCVSRLAEYGQNVQIFVNSANIQHQFYIENGCGSILARRQHVADWLIAENHKTMMARVNAGHPPQS